MAKKFPVSGVAFGQHENATIALRGTDGDRSGVSDIGPDLFPVDGTTPTSGSPRPRTKIPPERWPEVRAACGTRSLREAADEWGVSHETIRKIVGPQS